MSRHLFRYRHLAFGCLSGVVVMDSTVVAVAEFDTAVVALGNRH